MRLQRSRQTDPPRRKSEPTIALINIVFLMLIFFLVAAQIAPPLDRDVALVATRDLDPREPPDALVITASGALSYRGATVTPAQYVTMRQDSAPGRDDIRVVPDRDLPATRLIGIGNELRRLGVERIFIVTERTLGAS